MAITGFFHHIGTFLLFVATILLIITSISAPVVNNLALMKVHLGNATNSHYSELSFGSWGYCVLNTADGYDECTGRHVGYHVADVLSNIEETSFSDAARDTANGLTNVMVLHPIACGISFIAFLLALGAGFVGSFLAAIVAVIAFIVTLVVMVIDFVLFGIIKDHVNSNDDDSSGSHATFSAAIWTVLVAAICLLIGAVIVFFTCCSARLHKKRERKGAAATKTDYGAPAPKRRRWF